ncbi:Acetylcholine receptor subunit alpha [Seminavis robusta]|uniref:Acetylcholine receptor subunit alpha n=1 Tax=Seminavis robusta TaxID=568900 RepID=A0A9N8DGY2_9STRA|nr:Acetylcholine receptor subunit alpha [Seminavis robusta]|eukprot:Sro85_g045400.1 Acetylcholine receptor subunit alpha (630) ;mRNA; r:72724-74613
MTAASPLWLLLLWVCFYHGISAASPRMHPGAARRRAQQQQQQQQQLDAYPNNLPNSTQALRRALLVNYDRRSFPFESVWRQDQQEERSGLPVDVGLNFHRVLKVDVTSSVADLIVWVRQEWTDPRLRWNPADYNNLTTLHVWVGGDGSGVGGETSEIWTPDLQLWNLEVPLEESLASASALVSSNGRVFWSRPGHVRPVCKFRGLDDFPFDTLECTLEIGSWAYTGLYIRPLKMEQGFTIGGSETAGESYAEFTLRDVHCEAYTYPPFPGAPEEDWPVLHYHLAFSRSWQPYARGYLILQVTLNLVAFTAFWLPPHIGERMGLSITAMLAAVASELVVAANVPAAAELTWFAKFSLISLFFSALALMVSAAVIYFHYHTGDDLVPRWVRWIQQRVLQSRNNNNNNNKEMRFSLPPERYHHQSQVKFAQCQDASASSLSEAKREEPICCKSDEDDDDEGSVVVEFVEVDDESQNKLFASSLLSEEKKEDNLLVEPICKSDDDEGSVVVEFEADDDDIDADDIDDGDDDDNVNNDNSNNNLETIVGDVHNRRQRYRSRRDSTISFRASTRTRKSIKTTMGRDADDFKNLHEMKNNWRWQQVARAIDDAARVLFPFAYAIALSVVLAKAESW